MIAQHRSYCINSILLALSVGASALRAQVSLASEPSEFISEVISLKYVRASDVAAALIRMATNSASATTAASSPVVVPSPGTTANLAGNTRSNAWNISSQFLQSLIPKAEVPGGITDLGQSPIVADERTNALLIYATREDLQRVKEMIAQLDNGRVQVVIEALVIEVSAWDPNTLDRSYLGGRTLGPDSYSFEAGALSRSNLLSVTRFVAPGQTNATANPLSGFDYQAGLTEDLDALVPALASDSRVKIRQRPRLQTSQGEMASFLVGESLPYPTSSKYGGGVASIHQLRIGVTLDLTPSVMPDGFVVMDILQHIDEISGWVTIANVGDVPVTSLKESRAKVVVRDRETFLLGGLIETDKTPTRSGVPLLKDIPLLGSLFGRSSVRTTSNELLVLIRPTVLPQADQNTLSTAANGDRVTQPPIAVGGK